MIAVKDVPRWSGIIPLLVLIPACLTGAEEDQPRAIQTSPAALQGTSTFTRMSDDSCDDTVTDLDIFRFEQVLQEAARIARPVATSTAMKECLSQVMTVGNVSFPSPHSPLPWGPYEPDNAPTDPFNSGVLQSANVATRRATHMVNVWNHTKSILDIKGQCSNASGGGAFQGPRIFTSWFKPEVMNFRRQEVLDSVADWNAGGTIRRDRVIAIAGLTWHEAMHDHGYEHDATEANHVRKVPHIVGTCIQDVLTDSFANCSQTACATGEFNTVSSFNGTSCTCVADPAVPQAASSTVTQPSGATRLTVDSWGRAYMLFSGDVWRHPLEVHNFGKPSGKTVSNIFAGGLQIYALTTDGGLYRGLGSSWETVQSSGVLQVAVDDFGTAYYRTASAVMVKRLGSASPVSIRSAAASIFAGGDRVYATSPTNGDIFMYDHEFNTWFIAGSAGAQFAVDSHGVLHGLTPDFQLVVRNHRDEFGNHWNTVGGAAASIAAGNHLFGRNSSGGVFERYPNGTWELVTSGGAQVQERGGGIWGILNGSIVRFRR